MDGAEPARTAARIACRGLGLEAELQADRYLVAGVVGADRVADAARRGVRGPVRPRPFEAHAHCRVEIVAKPDPVVQPEGLAPGRIGESRIGVERSRGVRLFVTDPAIDLELRLQRPARIDV